MKPILYYTIYNFDIVYLQHINEDHRIIRRLFHKQYFYKRFYQTFLIGV